MAIGTTVHVGWDATKVQRGLAKMKGSLASVGNDIIGLTAKSVKWAAALAAAAGAFAAFQVGKFTVDSVKAAAAFESLTVKFEVLTGSAWKAKKSLDAIEKFGAQTPLEQDDLQQATIKLLAMGIALEDTMPILKMLGEVSMGNGVVLNELAAVYGKISSKGKLMGEELNQLREKGFDPLISVSKRTGRSVEEMAADISGANITIKEVRQAFVDATSKGGRFKDMLYKISQTTEGRFSNMIDNVNALKRALGKGLLEGAKAGLDVMNEQMPQYLKKFEEIGALGGKAIAMAFEGDTQLLEDVFTVLGDKAGKAFIKSFKESAKSIWDYWVKGWEDIGKKAYAWDFNRQNGTKVDLTGKRYTSDIAQDYTPRLNTNAGDEYSKRVAEATARMEAHLAAIRAEAELSRVTLTLSQFKGVTGF